MSEVNKMKKLAIKTNDVLVAIGLICVLVGTVLSTVAIGPIALVWGVVCFVVWAVASGFWCVLSGIHDELKKLNKTA